jgi:hypothetical protein
MRDFRGVEVEKLGNECVSISFVSFRTGVDERTVLALVQEESVREGAGGDSGEKREASTG